MSDVRLISFDIFDTLITRCVSNSTGVLNILAHRVSNTGIYGNDDFADKRVQSEQTAIKRYGFEEVTLEGIYTCFPGLSVEQRKRLMELEENVEIDLAIPIIAGKEKFLEAKKEGIPVVLISDMYLSKKAISKILYKCGIVEFDEIYVSSEFGATKHTGRLYDIVCDHYQVTPMQIRHYGDNIYADYVVPNRKGIKAQLLLYGKRTTPFKAKLIKTIKGLRCPEFSIARNACLSSKNDYIEIGYKALGPLLYGFCRWLHDRKNSLGIEKLLFLSRDGYIMHKAYQILYQNDKVEYIYASRRAWTVPAFSNEFDPYKLIDECGLGRELSFEELFSRLGIEECDRNSIYKESGFDGSERITTYQLINDNKITNIIRRIWPRVYSNALQERGACISYISNKFNSEKIGIVDIGWRGNMQHAVNKLFKLARIKGETYGLYIGVSKESKWQTEQHMEGYLFNVSDETMQEYESVYNALLEAFFVAPHGSLRKYTLDAGLPKPVFEIAEEGIKNRASPLFEIQEGAIQYIEDIVAGGWDRFIDSKVLSNTSELERVGLKPSLREARLLGEIQFAYKEYSRLASPRSFIHYCLHPRALILDFSTCYWKPAFLKRIFKLPINFGLMYICIRRLAINRIKPGSFS